jgi:hypothetical protein
MQHKKDDNDNNGSNGDNTSETDAFPNAVWPESYSEPKEEHIFTLPGNTHVNWSCTWELVIKFAAKLHWRYVCVYFMFIVCGGLLYYRRFMERE